MFSALPAIGSVVAGKYRVEALLGEGGMGAVFRAHHELMDKRVALKWLHPRLWDHSEAKERFVREARAASRLRHPNVVEVYDVSVQEDALFMVMELLEGETLEQLLTRGALSLPQALALVAGAMRGVAAAHARGIIHRDIKPENIFVTREGVAKILDFGISKLREEGGPGQQVTKTGSTMGTPAYMSIEHMNGAKDVDERSDVYSFGVVLYRVLTGRVPFDGDTFAAVAVQVATARPPSPKALQPELPVYLDALVRKAMSRRRERRFESMNALIDALAGALSDDDTSHLVSEPSRTPASVSDAAHDAALWQSTRKLEPLPAISQPMSTEPPAPRAVRARHAPWVVGGLALLVLSGLGWLFLRSTGEPARSAAVPAPPSLDASVVRPPAQPALSLQPARAPGSAPGSPPSDNTEWEPPEPAPAAPHPVEVAPRPDVALAPRVRGSAAAPVSRGSAAANDARADAGVSSARRPAPRVIPRSAPVRATQF